MHVASSLSEALQRAREILERLDAPEFLGVADAALSEVRRALDLVEDGGDRRHWGTPYRATGFSLNRPERLKRTARRQAHLARSVAVDAGDADVRVSRAEKRAIDAEALARAVIQRSAVAESERARLAFIADVSAELARSLDEDELISRLARLVVPQLADFTVVDILASGQHRKLGISHVDPAREAALRDLVRRFPAEKRGVSSPRRSPRLSETCPVEPTLRTLTRAIPGGQTLLLGLSVGASMTIPLTSRGRALGVMTLARLSPEQSYNPAEIALANELARRGAQAIANAGLYNEALDAIAAREEFVSIAAHELRTPLTSLSLELETAERRIHLASAAAGGLPTELERSVSAARRQTRRLATLITTLLDLTRMASGRLELDRQNFDLVNLVREVLNRHSPEILSASCGLSFQADHSVIGCWDRVRIEQVVTNLLANALKYAPGTSLEVVVRRTPSGASLTFKDGGPGIPSTEVERVFERFRRATPSNSRASLGLGLYISRHIVQAHAGRIELQSELGCGATFVIELPRNPPA